MNDAKRQHGVARPMGAARLGALALTGMLLLSACSGSAAKPTEVKISAPANGTEVKVGQSLTIQGQATGDAIARVDVIVDGAVYATIPGPEAGVADFQVPEVPWTPTAAGQHTVVLSAFGPKPDEKLLGRSETVIITAQAAVVPPTPTVPPTVAPAAPPPQATVPSVGSTVAAGTPAGDAPAAPANPAPAGDAAGDAPSVTVTNEFVNVRKGPGIGYDKLGELKQNEKAPVKGRSADSSWYQVTFQNGTGWVIADYVSANAAAKGVPVAAAPPLPAQPAAQAPAAPAAPAQPDNSALVPLVPLAPTTAPAPVAPPAPAAATVGGRGVLRVNANPVSSGATVYATWNIPNFKEGSFDKGDGRGFVGPIAGAMTVDVPGVTGQRTVSLKWKDTSGAEQVDSVTLVISGQPVAAAPTVVNTTCAAGTADWRASATNNNEYQFCVRPGGDLEYVTSGVGSIQYYDTGKDQTLTVRWAIYGIKGLYFVLEPNDNKCGPRGSTGRNEPVAGDGTYTFNVKDLATGGYKLSMRVIRQDGVEVRYNEKFLCIGVGGSNNSGGGSSGGGGSAAPTAAP